MEGESSGITVDRSNLSHNTAQVHGEVFPSLLQLLILVSLAVISQRIQLLRDLEGLYTSKRHAVRSLLVD